MKRALMMAAMCVGLAAAGLAQDSTAAPSTTAPARTPEMVARYYQTKLSLTEDQRTKLVPVIAERQQKMESLKSDTSQPRVKMQKMKAAMEDSDKKMKGILTGDQWTRYEGMEAQAKEQMKERRSGKSQPVGSSVSSSSTRR